MKFKLLDRRGSEYIEQEYEIPLYKNVLVIERITQNEKEYIIFDKKDGRITYEVTDEEEKAKYISICDSLVDFVNGLQVKLVLDMEGNY